MIVDDLSQIKNKNFFAIIIGSGPAGLTTALELEKKKIFSIIIEAGSKEYDSNNLKFLEGKTIGDSYNDISKTRLRQFGGTSGHWAGYCNPFQDQDFNYWPIKKIDLDPFLFQAKEILSLENNFFYEKFSKNLNLFNVIYSSNPRLGDRFYSHIKKSKYIYLSLNTIFLNFNGKNGKVDSINCFKKNYHKIGAKFYILSCGGIENSRLLLWSQYKNPELFNLKLPIGNYYMDHPYHAIADGLITYDNLMNYCHKNKVINKPVLSCFNQMRLTSNFNFLKNKNISNSGMYILFHESKIDNHFLQQLICAAPKYIKTLYDTKTLRNTYQISVFLIQEQEALFNNKIKLGKNLDPLNVPLCEIHWKKSKLLRQSAKIMSVEFANLLINNDIGRLAINEYLFNEEEYHTIVGNHQLGGTRMGKNNQDSVVDKDLKVHGFENLFVNGSSVFPSGGYQHPTLTIVQLAMRLSKHILTKKV